MADGWVCQNIVHSSFFFFFFFFFFVPRLFEEKRRDTVFGFPRGVVRGPEFLVGTLSP